MSQGSNVYENLSDNQGSGFDWSAIVPTAVNAATSVANNLLNLRESRIARNWQEEMWKKQNEYNLPVNQVARLKDAGINPNLAFGSSASTMSANVPSPPPRSNFDIQSGILDYYRYKYEKQALLSEIKMRKEAERGARLDNDLKSAVLLDKIAAQIAGFRSEKSKGDWFVANNDEWYGSQLKGFQFKNDLMRAEKRLNDAKRKMTYQNLKAAVQEYNHLFNKYSFEDSYYKTGLNPYETSTIAGLARTLGSPILMPIRGNIYDRLIRTGISLYGRTHGRSQRAAEKFVKFLMRKTYNFGNRLQGNRQFNW